MVDVDGCGSSPGRSWLIPTTSLPPRFGVCAAIGDVRDTASAAITARASPFFIEFSFGAGACMIAHALTPQLSHLLAPATGLIALAARHVESGRVWRHP